MAVETNKILLEIEVSSSGVVKNLDQVNKQLGEVGLQAKKAKKELEGMGGAAGIAGATAAEFGRLISDLPYGLQAVTNNISQLGSMFALLVSSSGGVVKAFKNLGSVLMGPAGILIAFQAAVAAVEFFSRSTDKAKRAVLGLNAALEGQKSLIRGIGLLTEGELEKTVKILTQYSSEYKKLLENFLASGQASKEGVITLTNQFGEILNIRRSIEAKEKELGSLAEGRDKRRAQLLGQINELRYQEIELLDKITYLQREAIEDLDVSFNEYFDILFGKTKVVEEEPYFPFVNLLKLEGRLALEQEFENNKNLQKERERASKQRLDSEIATINALADIKMAEADIVESVFRTIADISEKSRFVQAVALIGESAAGIAKIIIDTQAANSILRAQQSAVLLANPPLAAAIGLKIKANKVAAAAGIAANVGATATALSKLKAPAGGVSSQSIGEGGESAPLGVAPQFNTVGASGINQLLQTIQGQQQRPVKAYVVSGDVTTAQSLDRNIITEAGI